LLARPAPASPCGINSGGASEQTLSLENLKCLDWSRFTKKLEPNFAKVNSPRSARLATPARRPPPAIALRSIAGRPPAALPLFFARAIFFRSAKVRKRFSSVLAPPAHARTLLILLPLIPFMEESKLL